MVSNKPSLPKFNKPSLPKFKSVNIVMADFFLLCK